VTARRLLIPALLCCLLLLATACDGGQGQGQGTPPEDDDAAGQSDTDAPAGQSHEDAPEVITAAARNTLDAGTARSSVMLTRDVEQHDEEEETDVSPADVQAWTLLDIEEDFAADRRRLVPGPRGGVGAAAGEVVVDGDTVHAAGEPEPGSDAAAEWHRAALEGVEGDILAGLRFPFRDTRMVLELLAAGVEEAELLSSEDADEAADGDEGSHWYRTQVSAGDGDASAWLDLVSGGEPLPLRVRLDAAREVVTAVTYESASDDPAADEVRVELAYEVAEDVQVEVPAEASEDDSEVAAVLRVVLRAGGGDVGAETGRERS
jgi:hypothetical protein